MRGSIFIGAHRYTYIYIIHKRLKITRVVSLMKLETCYATMCTLPPTLSATIFETTFHIPPWNAQNTKYSRVILLIIVSKNIGE